MNDFPNLTLAINDGIKRRLHTGVQVFVQTDGEVVVDDGFGEASPGQPMQRDTIMLWRSAGKPVTALAVLQAVEREQLSLDSRLASFFPEVAGQPTGEITIRDLLTHSVGEAVTDTGWPESDWPEIIVKTLSGLQRRSTSGAAYQPQATWFLLGEILQRIDSQRRDIRTILTDEIFCPLNLTQSFCGIQDHSVNQSLPTLFERETGQLVESPMSNGKWLSQPSPGGNLRGPVRELGLFYSMLCNGGLGPSSQRLVAEETIRQMTSRHRVNLFDTTLQHTIDFGLGVICDSNHHGIDTVPYGFGRWSSPNSFGHGGAQCAMAFCDPQRRLVVAWAANGFCGEGQHQRRNRAINEAIYRDLGFAE